jgi:hypothetical protein
MQEQACLREKISSSMNVSVYSGVGTNKKELARCLRVGKKKQCIRHKKKL